MPISSTISDAMFLQLGYRNRLNMYRWDNKAKTFVPFTTIRSTSAGRNSILSYDMTTNGYLNSVWNAKTSQQHLCLNGYYTLLITSESDLDSFGYGDASGLIQSNNPIGHYHTALKPLVTAGPYQRYLSVRDTRRHDSYGLNSHTTVILEHNHVANTLKVKGAIYPAGIRLDSEYFHTPGAANPHKVVAVMPDGGDNVIRIYTLPNNLSGSITTLHSQFAGGNGNYDYFAMLDLTSLDGAIRDIVFVASISGITNGSDALRLHKFNTTTDAIEVLGVVDVPEKVAAQPFEVHDIKSFQATCYAASTINYIALTTNDQRIIVYEYDVENTDLHLHSIVSSCGFDNHSTDPLSFSIVSLANSGVFMAVYERINDRASIYKWDTSDGFIHHHDIPVESELEFSSISLGVLQL